MKFNGKMSTIGLTLALAFGVSSIAVAATDADAPAHAKASVSKQDADYMKKLAQANMAEVAIAKVAQSRSKDEQVLAFSKQMIEDHTAGLNDVKMLADKKGVSLPAKPDKAHQEETAKLSKLEGDKFDKAYLTGPGLKDHEAALDLTKTVSQKADDADLKALAEKMSGVITKHLEMVQKVARK